MKNIEYNGWKNQATWALNLVIGEMILSVENITREEDLIENICEYVADLQNPYATDIIDCGVENLDLKETMKHIEDMSS